MTNDAIINGNKVLLSDIEKSAAENFHKSRKIFAWINGSLVFNDKDGDDRDHQHWMFDEFGITPEEFEVTPRGYLRPGRIQYFIGSSFGKLDQSKISAEDFSKVLKRYQKEIGVYPVSICNGVRVGKVGEVWEPLEVLVELY